MQLSLVSVNCMLNPVNARRCNNVRLYNVVSTSKRRRVFAGNVLPYHFNFPFLLLLLLETDGGNCFEIENKRGNRFVYTIVPKIVSCSFIFPFFAPGLHTSIVREVLSEKSEGHERT